MPTVGKYKAKERPDRLQEVVHEASQFSRTTSMHSLSSAKSMKSTKSVIKEEPAKHRKRVPFSKQRSVEPLHKEIEVQTSDERQPGGANDRAFGTIRAMIGSECSLEAPGIDFLTEKDTNVTSFEVKMSPTVPMKNNLKNKCDFFPKYVDLTPIKDQTTQTLYRESSAQTLAYLPEIIDKEMDEGLELFRLASLLPGDKPPGLYEVEILERARKRWSFTKALKTNFQRQLNEARELAIKSKYKTILQAFEWEKWIEREEYIQECQMMRLEIVVRMFDKREKEMHTASKTRIEMACERIEARRQDGLSKNDAHYQREMRRLQRMHMKLNRRWSRENPVYSMSNHCSEQYAPIKRHGEDPGQRHYVGKSGQKAFDMRIDDLEKRVTLDRLKCPYRQAKEWSKPKAIVKEIEQNFCSDQNLQKLYESLKGLRTQAAKHKMVPKCLKKRYHPELGDTTIPRMYEDDVDYTALYEQTVAVSEKPSLYTKRQLQEFERVRTATLQTLPPDRHLEYLAERRQEDLENLLHMYEGSTIGWIMQFLSEEMGRLREQRKLHFFSILAQKERWRREAAEAGLRQKENDMRHLYEEMFQECNLVNNEVSEDYINTILTTDMANVADKEAAEVITDLAKKIDVDIQRWLNNIKLIQTPLTFEPLRVTLRDMIFPDLNQVLERYEKSLIAKYIIDDVLFPNIWQILEPFDICTTLTSDFIDRLIDNDLLLLSTDSEGESRPAYLEAEAIIRKLIRQATPGRRWMTETERIAAETYNDLFDDVFWEIIWRVDNPPPVEPTLIHEIIEQSRIVEFATHIDKMLQVQFDAGTIAESIIIDEEHIRTQWLSLIKKLKVDNVTGSLIGDDIFLGDDPVNDTDLDTLIKYQVYTRATLGLNIPEDLYSIFSTLDMEKVTDIKELRRSKQQLDQIFKPAEISSSSLSEIGVVFEKAPTTSAETQTMAKDHVLNMLQSIVDGEEKEDIVSYAPDYEADDEQSILGDGLLEILPPQRRLSVSSQPSIGLVPDVMEFQSDEGEMDAAIIVDGVSQHGISLVDLHAHEGSVLVVPENWRRNETINEIITPKTQSIVSSLFPVDDDSKSEDKLSTGSKDSAGNIKKGGSKDQPHGSTAGSKASQPQTAGTKASQPQTAGAKDSTDAGKDHTAEQKGQKGTGIKQEPIETPQDQTDTTNDQPSGSKDKRTKSKGPKRSTSFKKEPSTSAKESKNALKSASGHQLTGTKGSEDESARMPSASKSHGSLGTSKSRVTLLEPIDSKGPLDGEADSYFSAKLSRQAPSANPSEYDLEKIEQVKSNLSIEVPEVEKDPELDAQSTMRD